MSSPRGRNIANASLCTPNDFECSWICGACWERVRQRSGTPTLVLAGRMMVPNHQTFDGRRSTATRFSEKWDAVGWPLSIRPCILD